MTTKLIELQDNTLVEIELQGDQVREISGSMADKVDATIDKIKPILLKVCKPVTAVMQELSQDMGIEKAEIELGLSFEIEGNLYITKTTANANLLVKLILKPQCSNSAVD